MERILTIPSSEIKKIHKLVKEGDTEYGGYFVFLGNGKFERNVKFKGDLLSVSVPTENYEIHWHTHPGKLIRSCCANQSGPIQPPSIDDIAQSSYKFFDYEFGMGHILVQLVFTKHGIYSQHVIPEIMKKYFRSTFLIHDEKDIDEWTKTWYEPFCKKASPIRKEISNIGFDLGGYINDDTGKYEQYPKEDREQMYLQSLELERQYFEICKEFGIAVYKIPNWKDMLKKGLTIDMPNLR